MSKKELVRFTAFSDFHYKKGTNLTTINDFNIITKRAMDFGADFMMCAGDFCSDFIRSKELFCAVKNLKIPFYNAVGNHELENQNNSLDYVVPLLTNDPNNVVKSAQKSYYYVDKNGVRFVFTDTNFSFNEEGKFWEHNRTASVGAPKGNLYENSLGDRQLNWLKDVLLDGGKKGLKCVVISHASFNQNWQYFSPSAKAVKEIFDHVNSKYLGSVLMAINGHRHLDRSQVIDDVIYLEINTTYNGFWKVKENYHYGDNHTFIYEDYDENGEFLGSYERKINSLVEGKNTYFFDTPLSANIVIYDDGSVSVKGVEGKWRYGISPNIEDKNCVPKITDNEF